jgi:S1-C subfamily serine protease
MVAEVKAAIIEILVVVKWDAVKDDDLPIDTSHMDPLTKGALSEMSPEDIKEMEAKAKKKLPRVGRDKLPAMTAAASGTGFVIKSPAGGVLAITNAHVVNAADEVAKKFGAKPELHIKLSDDQFSHNPDASDMIAEVGAIGKRGMDVAFLKIPASRKDGRAWSTLTLGDSDDAAEGEDVWAMGFPMGLNHTTTRGIVSAAHVTLDNPYVSYIQTDAAINPGNSGGPLIHRTDEAKAEVLGMDTQILSESGGSSGLGFAIESNSIKRALKQYIANGSIDVGYVGMVFGAGKGQDRDKVSVQSVAKGGPAEKAGLKAGDVIKTAGGQTLGTNAATAVFQVSKAVKAKDPGEVVELVVVRGGKDVSIKIKVEKEPKELPETEKSKAAQDDGDDN